MTTDRAHGLALAAWVATYRAATDFGLSQADARLDADRAYAREYRAAPITLRTRTDDDATP